MGSDKVTHEDSAAPTSFNPRSHMGSDPTAMRKSGHGFSFNPRSHMGSDVRVPSSLRWQLVFQSTLPHGERQRHQVSMDSMERFNPRSHMGSDLAPELPINRIIVSIHAPTWGATRSRGSQHHSIRFQSTLPHGERLRYWCFGNTSSCFNPRSHMGSDVNWITSRICYRRFNPRSHMGSDGVKVYPKQWDVKFQSTLPHGERLKVKLRQFSGNVFQSTLPHGERLGVPQST